MSSRALFLWFLFFMAILAFGIGFGIYAETDKVGMPDDTTIGVAMSPVHVAQQAAKTYIINGANLDGHLYYIIRLRNTDEFVVKHAASCPQKHGAGFFDG